MDSPKLSINQMTWRKASMQLPGLNQSEWTVDSAWFARKLPPSRTGNRPKLQSRTAGIRSPVASAECGLCISPMPLTSRSTRESVRLKSGLQGKETQNSVKCLPKSREIRSPAFRKRLYNYVSHSNFNCKRQKHWAAEALAYREVSKLVHRSETSLSQPKIPCEMRISTAPLTKRKPTKWHWSQLSGGETPLTPWRAAEF